MENRGEEKKSSCVVPYSSECLRGQGERVTVYAISWTYLTYFSSVFCLVSFSVHR